MRLILRLKKWFKDDIFNKLFKNAGVLFSGTVLAAIFAFISLAVTGRALGPEKLGILVLIQTYVSIIDVLVKFQPWQALIKYGADSLGKEKANDFKSLIAFCTAVDFISAIIGTVVSILGVFVVSQYFKWDISVQQMAVLYSLVIITHLSGTPIGILRLFDKFKLLAVQQIIGSLIKLIGVTIVWLLNYGIWQFMLVWMITDVVANLLLFGLSWREIKLNGFRKVITLDNFKGLINKFPGIIAFIVTTNLNTSVRMASREIDIMIVGAVLNPSAAGLYKIVKQFGSIVSKPLDPLYQAIYPELAKLWAIGDIHTFRQVSRRTSIITGSIATLIWVAILLMGNYLIYYTVGEQFIGAWSPLNWYALAIVIAMWSLPFQPMMLAMGYPRLSFRIQIISTIAYFIIFLLLLPGWQLIGACIAYVFYYLIWSFLMYIYQIRLIKRGCCSVKN